MAVYATDRPEALTTGTGNANRMAGSLLVSFYSVFLSPVSSNHVTWLFDHVLFI